MFGPYLMPYITMNSDFIQKRCRNSRASEIVKKRMVEIKKYIEELVFPTDIIEFS